MAFKLDLFKILDSLGGKDDAYAGLSDDEKKGFAPIVIQRWLSGTKDERQVVALNTFANKHVFALGKHPHLLARLFQACNSKVPRRYYWLGVKGRKKHALVDQVLKETFGWSSNELRKQGPLLHRLREDEIIAAAEELGWQKEELAKLKKELKDA